MAAYAALVSLTNTMDQIKNHPRLSFAFDGNQTEALAAKLRSLLHFIEAADGAHEAGLESQIASAAHAAEDAIESHVVDQAHVLAVSLLDLQTVIEEMDCVQEMVEKFRQGNESKPAAMQPPTSSSRPTSSAMIGLDDELIQLMEMLVGRESSRRRQIIPVHGMGGIGKTTLARNTYEHPTIANHFHIQAWAAVSQTYTPKGILYQLLNSCQNISVDDKDAEDYQLGEKLHKILSGRRYLIVLDDVWSVEAWERIMFFFPDNNNRSRIVVTTRLSNIAAYFGSSCLSMNLLDEDKSWSLFREKSFGQQGSIPPPELEKIGKEIAKKCKGLPLSISVIGGLLGKSSMTREYWENVAEDLNAVLNSGDDEHCLNILSLSYTHLPIHLKPCFLYMGVFPEDRTIRVSQLIKIWVAEGFLKQNNNTESLEDIAKRYTIDLVGRNLILPRKWGVSGKLKSCGIHDLLRDVCLRIAEKEKFLRVINISNNIPTDMTRDRRLVLNGYIHHKSFEDLECAPLARSLIFEMCQQEPFHFRLLRVFNFFYSNNKEILFHLVNLRYLAVEWMRMQELPSSIFMFWNLQTIVFTGYECVAPLEIWEMPQLRHLECERMHLPYPPSGLHGFVLRNLQTLKTIINMRVSEELCRRIPNVRRLGLTYRDGIQGDDYCLGNLEHLDKLESLNISLRGVLNRDDLLLYLKLPSLLQKLTLSCCKLRREDLEVIGSLPNLQVLRLYFVSFGGTEWNPAEGQFLELKHLRISLRDALLSWNADSCHFPVLEKLHLEGFSELEEIPLGIGEIPTLQHIHLVRCSESCAISAYEILEEQESQGNEGLRVRLQFSCKEEMESFSEKVKPHSHNIKLEL